MGSPGLAEILALRLRFRWRGQGRTANRVVRPDSLDLRARQGACSPASISSSGGFMKRVALRVALGIALVVPVNIRASQTSLPPLPPSNSTLNTMNLCTSISYKGHPQQADEKALREKIEAT